MKELKFKRCPYCKYPSNTFTKMIGVGYDKMRLHILEKHPKKIKHFIKNCIEVSHTN